MAASAAGPLLGAAILVRFLLHRSRPLGTARCAEPDPSMSTVAEGPDRRTPAPAERHRSAPGRDRPPILGSDREVAAHDQRAVLIHGHHRADLPGGSSLCASIG